MMIDERTGRGVGMRLSGVHHHRKKSKEKVASEREREWPHSLIEGEGGVRDRVIH